MVKLTDLLEHNRERLEKVTILRYPTLSLYEVLLVFFQKIKSEMIKERAESVAYNLTLATFPFIIFLFTLIPYIPVAELADNLFLEIERIFPTSVAREMINTIKGIISKQQAGLRSFSFLTTMYLATNGMNAFINSFNHTYHIVEKRSFLGRRITALLLTFSLFGVLMASIILIVSGEVILDALQSYQILNNQFLIIVIDILRYLIVLLAFFATVVMMYHFAPGKRISWRKLRIGAFMATIL
ncbi:MAG: YihY/virulence factor BrkB family protein, partial [Bacteroidota bacterium]